MRGIRFACFFTFCAFTTAALPQDAPSSGIIFNESENISLTYSCTQSNDSRLSCEFVQTSVRLKARAADLPGVLAAAKEQTGKQQDAGGCRILRTLRDVLEGKALVPKPEALTKITPTQRRDLSAMAKAGLAICASPTEANYIAFAKIEHDKSARTCVVSSNTFQQSFKSLPSGKSKAWVVESSASGDCGAVRLDRFEYEDAKSSVSGIGFWNYIAKKAITNPNGKLMGNLSCSQMDQAEYIYRWKTDERQVSCDYIEFKP